MSSSDPIVIVGGGLSGLACARSLALAGLRSIVLEASDGLGGRVRTDLLDREEGTYRLDRGFQVLLTAYPEAQRTFNLKALDLRTLYAGADVRVGNRFHRVANPWRHPIDAARGFASPVATLADKARLAELYARNRLSSLDELWARDERATIDVLRDSGFAPTTIDRFFRPFWGGVLFDSELLTSSRMFDFTFRMFASGTTTVPALGMGELSKQLASELAEGAVRLNQRVTALVRANGRVTGVVLESGERLSARAVVLACEGDATRDLIGPDAALPNRGWLGTTTLYFAMQTSDCPMKLPILMLNGNGASDGPVNHLVAPSTAAVEVAPTGWSLISANIVGVPACDDAPLEADVRRQLSGWFGPASATWKLLRIYRIPKALPDFRVSGGQPTLTPHVPLAGLATGAYVCGDHRASASIDGALVSGRVAAESVLKDLQSMSG